MTSMKPLAIVAVAEPGDEMQQGEVDEEHAGLGAEHAPGGEGHALLAVRRERGEDGRDRRVDAGVEDA